MSRKVPSVSAANYASIFTAPVFRDQNGEWYRDVGYVDSLDIIRDNFLSAGKSFVAIGYYLKHIREKELYKEGGYANIWECARAEFGLSDTAASNYMKMNDAYSVNGNTPVLDDKYGGFNKSQLQEMLALTTEKREEIMPEQTVSEIREIAKEEKKEKEPSEAEIRRFYTGYVKDMDNEPRNTLKERLKERYRHAGAGCDDISWQGSARGIRINKADEITWAQLVKLIDQYIPQEEEKAAEAVQEKEEPQIPGQMVIGDYPEVMPDDTKEPDREAEKLSSYGLPVTEYPEGSLLTTEGCGHKYDCFACAQDCGIRQKNRYCVEAPPGNPFSCTTMEVLGQLKEEMGDSCQFISQEKAYHRPGDNAADPCCKDCTETCGYRCRRSAAKTDEEGSSAGSMPETQDVKEGTPESETAVVKWILDKERRLLNDYTEAGGIPEATVLRQEIIVNALELLVREQESGQEETIQPELPLLENTDRRKEWLRNYKAWGLWYRDENIDVNYYKYDFQDGSRLIVAEHPQRRDYRRKDARDEYFFHLLEKGKKGYGNTRYDEKYRNTPDGETYLAEFLKGLKKQWQR